MVKRLDPKPRSASYRPNWLQRQAWHTVRLLQLAFGMFCLGDFLFYSGEWAVLALGAIMLIQGVFDWQLGCVGRHSCIRDS